MPPKIYKEVDKNCNSRTKPAHERKEMGKEDTLSKNIRKEEKKEEKRKAKEIKDAVKEKEKLEKQEIRNKKKQDKLNAEQLKLEQKAAAKKMVEDEIAQKYKLLEERRLEIIAKKNHKQMLIKNEQERVLKLPTEQQNILREQDLNSTEERSIELHARLKLWTNIRLKKYIDALTEIEKLAYDITEQHLESSFDFEKSNWFIENKSIIDSS